MLNSIKKILTPPIFENEENTRVAQYLNAILYGGVFLSSFLIIFRGNFFSGTNIVLAILVVSMVGMQILLRQEKVQFTAVFLISLAWIAMTYMAWQADGIRNASLIVYILLILLASLLGSSRILIFFTFLSLASMWTLVYAEKSNIITPTLDTITNLATDLSVIFLLITIIIYITTTNINKALSIAKKNEKEALLRNKALIELQSELEKRVNIRTAELKTQTSQLQAIADTSKAIALVQNLDTLLPQIASLISERFDFYHVGIFLFSNNKEFVQLQAANSIGGKRMLARQHKLRVGQSGIVGRVAHDGEARIALDAGHDVAYFNNPDLPDTRSEMALPLKIGHKIIGVLDVQSKREAIFSEENLKIFHALANQVSIAIENARQADMTRAALEEARFITTQYTQQAWKDIASSKSQLGYSYANETIHPITEEEVFSGEDENIITIPVKVHDVEIGRLRIQQDASALSAENKAFIESVTNRAALALENARLLEDSQRRAARESTIGNISNKIGASIQIDTIIQTTVQELGEALDNSEVIFRLASSPKEAPLDATKNKEEPC